MTLCHFTAHEIYLEKKMTKLLIFDLDGTLLDTRADIAAACNHALRSCGCPERELDEYNMLVGRGIYNLFRAALPEQMRSEENVMKMKSFFVPYYDRHIADSTLPYPGIIEMLDSLSAEGVAFAIASNKYQAGTEALVERFFSGYSFVRISGQREGQPIKPDPAIVSEIIACLPGTDIGEVVYCGDSDVDMQTGINAGVRTIGVTWGFRTREELAGYEPWLLAENPQEIVKKIIFEG